MATSGRNSAITTNCPAKIRPEWKWLVKWGSNQGLFQQPVKQKPDPKRRAFLRGTASAGVGVAVAASLPGLTTASTDESSSESAKTKKGYRLTPHIAAYYKSTVS